MTGTTETNSITALHAFLLISGLTSSGEKKGVVQTDVLVCIPQILLEAH